MTPVEVGRITVDGSGYVALVVTEDGINIEVDSTHWPPAPGRTNVTLTPAGARELASLLNQAAERFADLRTQVKAYDRQIQDLIDQQRDLIQDLIDQQRDLRARQVRATRKVMK